MSSDLETTDTTVSQFLGSDTEQFAADLRQLRDGYPRKLTLDELAQVSGTPRSTLSAVLNGKKLPSERTLVAVVTALDGDSKAWLDRRERLRLAALGIPADAIATLPSDTAPATTMMAMPNTPNPKAAWLRPRWLLVLLLIVALIVGAGLVTAITWRATAPADPWSPGIVQTGDDPGFHPECLEDAIIGAAETRQEFYLMEIIWSAHCRAAWGRITRYDDMSFGNSVAVTTFLRDDPDGPSTQQSDDPDTQCSYTFLIASHSIDDKICVKGTVTKDAEVIDLGTPLCL